jgi:acyl-coenzyme A thioesterase PaaI-like protein
MTTSTHTPNRLERQLERLTEVPAFARPWFRNVVLRRAVPFTGTAGLAFVEMTTGRVEIGIRNEKKVQNHIGGVHASAMNLLAETATGMVVGMNVRDDCIPLAKELKMAFKKRATGALRAVATLSDEQRGPTTCWSRRCRPRWRKCLRWTPRRLKTLFAAARFPRARKA